EPTDMGVFMPRTLGLLQALTSIPGRVKLSMMQPHSRVEYHVHDDASYVVHVPLASHPLVRMLVRMGGVEYAQVYEPGTAWLFNSHHEHAVENDSDMPRLHLWCNFMQVSKGEVNQRMNALVEAALQLHGAPA
ncbi:MAG TPA: aspartyl/asparaginyl beta-hydroxylase domain-containing protein, partial [Ramlibacter sp.]|nr:aspartyl/asparaginyl beta-hydroxylase domain-containing protein [Ramlibacter sp.]